MTKHSLKVIIIAVVAAIIVISVSCATIGRGRNQVYALPGFGTPVTGRIPQTTIETPNFTGTILWYPGHEVFAPSTVYTATITLTPTGNFLPANITENFFTMLGAESITNKAGSNQVTVTFAETAANIGDYVPGRGILVWHDEFEGTALDRTRWNYERGVGIHYHPHLWGWGNMERQYYLPDNIRVENGFLVIEAARQSPPLNTMHFTSGRITTAGVMHPNTRQVTPPTFITYPTGFVEGRLRAPRGRGFWPCFWLIGANYLEHSGFDMMFWPYCGEVNIFEATGYDIYLVEQTIHYGKEFPHQYNFRTHQTRLDRNFVDYFHTFGVGWDETEMRFYINGKRTTTINFSVLEAERPWANTAAFTGGPGFAVQLNVALGGHYVGHHSGEPGNTNIVPADYIFDSPDWKSRSLIVDWVRVYR